MTVDGVVKVSESARWVVLQMYGGCLIVLPREQFKQSPRRGKWWKRAAAMRARQDDAETAVDRRRGAVDASWDGWSWVWLAGEGRVAMMLITGLPPVRFVYPRQDWAGAIPWFDRAGVGLVFNEDDDDALA